ncbi:MAG: FixH family protein [Blastocatellia bacterium]
MKRQFLNTLLFITFVSVSLYFAACTKPASGSGSAPGSSGQVIASQKAGDLTVTLASARGHLTEGSNDFTVEFRNAAGQPVEVGAVTLMFEMPAMGAMPRMESRAKLTTTSTPGIYQATTSLEMGGTWQVHVQYKGAAGEGRADFSIQAK